MLGLALATTVEEAEAETARLRTELNAAKEKVASLNEALETSRRDAAAQSEKARLALVQRDTAIRDGEALAGRLTAAARASGEARDAAEAKAKDAAVNLEARKADWSAERADLAARRDEALAAVDVAKAAAEREEAENAALRERVRAQAEELSVVRAKLADAVARAEAMEAGQRVMRRQHEEQLAAERNAHAATQRRHEAERGKK